MIDMKNAFKILMLFFYFLAICSFNQGEPDTLTFTLLIMSLVCEAFYLSGKEK